IRDVQEGRDPPAVYRDPAKNTFRDVVTTYGTLPKSESWKEHCAKLVASGRGWQTRVQTAGTRLRRGNDTIRDSLALRDDRARAHPLQRGGWRRAAGRPLPWRRGRLVGRGGLRTHDAAARGSIPDLCARRRWRLRGDGPAGARAGGDARPGGPARSLHGHPVPRPGLPGG